MAFDYQDIQLALRTQLQTLSVATTGLISMSATTADGFVRTSGSFLTDGFKAGMEIAPDSMTEALNNAVAVVKAVAELTMSVDRTLEAESAGSGKSLAAGIPSRVQWEQIHFDPEEGTPYFEEVLLPGSTEQVSAGPSGWMELQPLYVVNIYVPINAGIGAHNVYADAIMNLFAPRTAMLLTNGDNLLVRASPGPFRGQVIDADKDGWVVCPVTVPLRLFTTNP